MRMYKQIQKKFKLNSNLIHFKAYSKKIIFFSCLSKFVTSYYIFIHIHQMQIIRQDTRNEKNSLKKKKDHCHRRVIMMRVVEDEKVGWFRQLSQTGVLWETFLRTLQHLQQMLRVLLPQRSGKEIHSCCICAAELVEDKEEV